jgi:hypothetical protein
MGAMKNKITWAIVCLLLPFVNGSSTSGTLKAQERGRRARVSTTNQATLEENSLTGVYRLDPLSSDKLYSLINEADTNLPYAKQQRFFDDLTVRLTSPDQLAIERRGRVVSIASSRAPRITFEADGRVRAERGEDNQTTRTRAALEAGRLVVSSEGDGKDDFNVTFETFDNGRRLRVTRRITADNLNQPLIVRSIYDKVADVARWSIFEEPSNTRTANNTVNNSSQNTSSDVPDTAPLAATVRVSSSTTDDEQADALRTDLNEWLAATNANDIERQLDFYLPRLNAYYLERNVSLASVRADKSRTFKRANRIAITADAPEIILRDAAQTAVMRFRKQYEIQTSTQNRRGTVIQELRWRRTPAGWKIFSERDVRVIR